MKGQHSSKGSRQSKGALFSILFVLLLLAVVATILFTRPKNGDNQGKLSESTEQTETTVSSEQTASVEKLTDTIDMPGYSWLNLKADTTEQELTLPNPPQNFCQMRMSLLLEDGTVLWTSELVQPGESSKPIILSQPLAKGEYKNAMLKYECFKIDEAMTPLNGGQIVLSLKVY